MAFSLFLVQAVLLKGEENAIEDTFYVRRKSVGVCYEWLFLLENAHKMLPKEKKIVILVESHTTFTSTHKWINQINETKQNIA